MGVSFHLPLVKRAWPTNQMNVKKRISQSQKLSLSSSMLCEFFDPLAGELEFSQGFGVPAAERGNHGEGEDECEEGLDFEFVVDSPGVQELPGS
jgi:hypothetical protein